MAITKPLSKPHSLQHIANQSFDEANQVIVHQNLKTDGQSLQRENADNLALKVTVVGSVTYLATAAPGTAQATARWQCQKIDETTGVVITWADGDSEFDNVASDLTALTYS